MIIIPPSIPTYAWGLRKAPARHPAPHSAGARGGLPGMTRSSRWTLVLLLSAPVPAPHPQGIIHQELVIVRTTAESICELTHNVDTTTHRRHNPL